MSTTILEFCYKCDELDDPIINDYHILALGYASAEELAEIKRLTFRINELMTAFFDERDLILVDFKLEFGKREGQVVLADEICPIPAVSGRRAPSRRWTRTASAATWAASRTPTRRSAAG